MRPQRSFRGYDPLEWAEMSDSQRRARIDSLLAEIEKKRAEIQSSERHWTQWKCSYQRAA